jgi:hypothetical protein
MQIDARLIDLKNTVDKPRINFKMDMFDPKDKDDVLREIDHFLTRYEYYCTANNLSTDALEIDFFPVYLCPHVQMRAFQWIPLIMTWEELKMKMLKYIETRCF